jgi:hypothetical protein
MTLPQMRTQAKKQLLAYRRNNARAYRNPSRRAQSECDDGWVHAIEAARAYFRSTNPLKERFMCRLFGLETPVPRRQPTRERMIKLSIELCVSESTLYKWREDVFEIVLYAAVEGGLLRPFGLGGGQTERKGEEIETKHSGD